MARRSNQSVTSPPARYSAIVRSPSPPRQRRVRERRGSFVDNILNLKSWRKSKSNLSYKSGSTTSSRRESDSRLSFKVDRTSTKKSSYEWSVAKTTVDEEHDDHHEHDGRVEHKHHNERENKHVPATPRRRIRRTMSVTSPKDDNTDIPADNNGPVMATDKVPETPSGHYCYTCGVLRSDEYHALHPMDPDEEPSPNACTACRRRFTLIKMGKARIVDAKVERDSKTRWCDGCGVIRASQHPETREENLCRRCKRSAEALKTSSDGSGRSSRASSHCSEASDHCSKASRYRSKVSARHSKVCLHSPKASSETLKPSIERSRASTEHSKAPKRSSKACSTPKNASDSDGYASEEFTEASDSDSEACEDTKSRLQSRSRPVTPSQNKPVKPILKKQKSTASVGQRSVRFYFSSSDSSEASGPTADSKDEETKADAPHEPAKKSVPISEQFYHSQLGAQGGFETSRRMVYAASESHSAQVNVQTQEHKSATQGTKHRTASGSSHQHREAARGSPKPPKPAQKATVQEQQKPATAPRSSESQRAPETEEDRRQAMREWYAAQRKAFEEEKKQQQQQRQQARAPPTPPSTPPNTPFGTFGNEKLGVWDTDEPEESWIKMDDRLRAESEARLFAAAAAASGSRPRAASVSSNEDETPPTPRGAHFSAISPPTSSADVWVSPKLPQAVVWEVSSVEADEIEAERTSRRRRGGWN
ncbi:hypothetical protein QBC34DRAFT_380268 [Podospora aff. communis PSN243]|uniref:Stc1 domain-containing protein n=1 Tax=Podospora aff. communis PSN243 TaxID=3040156 RepID=A0AAV9GLR0_9PEZI|nr:hypothetical protein QBC34DRAFT_380268 [Podospora aff. communis PSN243]